MEVDRIDLRRLYEQGQVSDDTLVWKAPLKDWSPLALLPWLEKQVSERPPPAPPRSDAGNPLSSTLDALAYGWRQRRALPKQWPLLLAQYFPLAAAVINRGWRIAFLRMPRDQAFPRFDLVGMARDSLLLWMVYGIYLLPELVFLAFQGLDTIKGWWQLGRWLIALLATGSPPPGAGGLLGDFLVGFVLGSGFLIFYPVLTWPFFRLGMMRYARERSLRVFFDLRNNYRLVARNFPLLMSLYCQNKLLWALGAAIAGLVAATVVAAPLVPGTVVPARLVGSGVLYREAMRRIFPEGAVQSARAGQVDD